MTKHLFNSYGHWIDIKNGKYIYNIQRSCIGWFPWDDNDAVNLNGSYLGSIFNDNRFYKKINFPYRGNIGYPGHPGVQGYQGHISNISTSTRPKDVRDFLQEELIDILNN